MISHPNKRFSDKLEPKGRLQAHQSDLQKPQQSGWSKAAQTNRWSSGYTGKPCADSGHRRSAAPFSPPRRAAAYIRQQQAGSFRGRPDIQGKPLRAVGIDARLHRSPRVVLPQISGDSSPTDFGGRLAILGKLCATAGADALLRRSLPALYCCPYQQQRSGGFRRVTGYIGQAVAGSGYRRSAASLSPRVVRPSRIYDGSGPADFGGRPLYRASCARQRAQMLCCAALSPRCAADAYIRGRQRSGDFRRSRPAPHTAAKPCYCKSCVTAFGGQPAILGRGQTVRGQRVQTFRCAALPRAVLLPLISGGRQRFGDFQRARPAPRTAAKPCFCKSCVTAYGRSTLRRVL